jgi:hypothetical protein
VIFTTDGKSKLLGLSLFFTLMIKGYRSSQGSIFENKIVLVGYVAAS